MNGTSFIQYERCNLCRINHKKGKKHVYAKKHRDTVESLLTKFQSKIEEARKEMKSPVFNPMVAIATEPKFWCHFCVQDVPRAVDFDGIQVLNLGILSHITSHEHKEKTLAFWRDNHLSSCRMQPFIELKEDYEIMKKRVEELSNQYRISQQHRLINEAKKIKLEDVQRKQLVDVCRQMVSTVWQPPMTSFKHTLSSRRFNQRSLEGQSSQEETGFMRTVAAHGPNLTRISIPKDHSLTGNVHSGALPPWLQAEDCATSLPSTSKPIGPTAEEFAKHLQNLKKRKLPSARVGAQFDRNRGGGDAWLPSFGRVWSKNRRQHSKGYFTKALKFNRSLESINKEAKGKPSTCFNAAGVHKVYGPNTSESGRRINTITSSSHAKSNGLSSVANSLFHQLPGAYKSRRQKSRPMTDQQITVATNLL